jgi:rare lipoprotein A
MGRFLLCALAILALGNSAAETRVDVVLQDGGVFTGESITHSKGLYFLDQGSRGILTIPAKLVREVRAPEIIETDAGVVAGSAVIVEHGAETAASGDSEVVSPESSAPLFADTPPPRATPTPAAAVAPSEQEAVPPREITPVEAEALATWYGSPYHGKPTASGETFDMNALTAAHATLPFGTVVTVTNLHNGREVELRINDRVPRAAPKRINISRAAAEQLDFVWEGSALVRVDIVEQ